MTAVLGIDVGLSAVRAAVVDSDGRLLGHARREHSPRIAAGRAEQDARDLAAGMWAAGREAVRSAAAPIDAIAVSALGPAPVLVDRGGRPLGPALLFGLDTRAESQRAVLGVSHDHALPKLLWWQDEQPQLVARARHALDATGYLVLALTGAAVMDEVTSDAYRAPGAMSPVPLPDPIAATTIAGSLQAEAAGELGLPAGIPVAAGTIDSYADVAGTGVAIGDGVLLLGSTLVIYAVAAEPTRLPGLDCERYPGPGVLVGGCTNAAGLALAWARRELGAADAAEVAALPPGAGGLLALPYLAGERTPITDPLATGLIVGPAHDDDRGADAAGDPGRGRVQRPRPRRPPRSARARACHVARHRRRRARRGAPAGRRRRARRAARRDAPRRARDRACRARAARCWMRVPPGGRAHRAASCGGERDLPGVAPAVPRRLPLAGTGHARSRQRRLARPVPGSRCEASVPGSVNGVAVTLVCWYWRSQARLRRARHHFRLVQLARVRHGERPGRQHAQAGIRSGGRKRRTRRLRGVGRRRHVRHADAIVVEGIADEHDVRLELDLACTCTCH